MDAQEWVDGRRALPRILAAVAGVCALVVVLSSAAAAHAATATVSRSARQTLVTATEARAGVGRAVRVGTAPARERLQLVLPLAGDEAALERFATAVSTVGSPEYAHYASIPELAARFGAGTRARATVIHFLRSHGATDVRIDATGLFADATISAAGADRLFATKLARFSGAHVARFTAPAATVSIPAALRGIVTGVVGLDTHPIHVASNVARTPRREDVRADVSSSASDYACSTPNFPTSTTCLGATRGCSKGTSTGGFTPNEYLNAYGDSALQQQGLLGQGERVALIEIDGFKVSDINAFARCFGLKVPRINGFGLGAVSKPLTPGGESTLDIEVLDSVAPDLRSIDVYEAGSEPSQTLKALTAPLQNAGYTPDVISVSLGLCEQYTAAEVSPSALRAAEGALAEAAASGISFVAASGDDGSADCVDSSGSPQNPPGLAVNYPASSPWVTAVGGTNLTLTSAGHDRAGQRGRVERCQHAPGPRRVEHVGAGGGGFSASFTRPSYQASVVTSPVSGGPDVAMLADVAPGYSIYCSASRCTSGGTPAWQTVGGTSAATPCSPAASR